MDNYFAIKITNSHNSELFVELAVSTITLDYETGNVHITCPEGEPDIVFPINEVNQIKTVPGIGITGFVLWDHIWDDFVEQIL